MDDRPERDAAARDAVRRREVVSEIGRRALEVESLDRLLSDACVAVAEVLDAECAAVFERVIGADEVRVRRAVGWPEDVVDGRQIPAASDSPVGRALRSGEAVVDDFRSDERFSESALASDDGICSVVGVVIRSNGDPWGVLGTYDTDGRAFADEDASFLRDVANVLEGAVEAESGPVEAASPHPEERYRALVESIEQGFCVLEVLFDDDGTPVDYRVVEANRTFEEYTGLENADGKTVNELDAGIERHWYERYGEVARSREATHFEERVEAWDRWFEGYAFPIGDPEERYVAVLFDDVTERKHRERELELFRNLLDHSTDSVYVIEPETGRIVDVNATARQRTGYSRAELLERTVPELEVKIPNHDAWRSLVERVETGRLQTFDGIRLCKDGSTFPVEVNLSYVELDRPYALAMARDVTERRERERKLERSNERLEQFAYAASHDLQEPLRMVSTYLKLIERRCEGEMDEDVGEFLAYAVDGADRMREMIDGLLAYSRVESGGEPFESVELEAVLSDVLDDLRIPIGERDAEITVGDLPRVRGDATQLGQLFRNLLDNAIEYGGESPPQAHVAAERDGPMWRLSVRDDGIGIAQRDRERVFQIFQRLHTRDEHAGAGIGLALCQRIVERHGGEIWIDAEPGEGTTVSFTLPRADASNGARD